MPGGGSKVSQARPRLVFPVPPISGPHSNCPELKAAPKRISGGTEVSVKINISIGPAVSIVTLPIDTRKKEGWNDGSPLPGRRAKRGPVRFTRQVSRNNLFAGFGGMFVHG